MKLTLSKPIYHKGAVLLTGTDLETTDSHGRELLRKGYATQPQTKQPKAAKGSNKAQDAKGSNKAQDAKANDE